MSTLREIKQRIGSVKNISQVTNAMQLVAASRMKKTQDNAARGKLYANKLYDVMLNLSKDATSVTNPFIDIKYSDSTNVMFIVFSTQRGLAGGLPSNLLKLAVKKTQDYENKGKKVQFVTIGKKLRDQLLSRGLNVVADFSDMPETPTTSDIQPITRLITQSYLAKEVGEIIILYADFINSMIQEAKTLKLLPLEISDFESQELTNKTIPSGVLFEPDEETILQTLVPTYIETQLFQKRLETVASEYSSRMMAMRAATDNAKEIMGDLQIEFNKKRQAAITQELAEINGGRI
ncbi:ATP synthase F1 subunit gamma [Candidatus Woesebacteria bacterium]|nr:MAG: ATP synthase F1 subunit gamma [Candidatus Woesebacteria bacterium]